MAVSGKSVLELVIAARDRTHGAFLKLNTQMRSVKGSAGGLNKSLGKVQGALGGLSGSANKLVTALGPMGVAGIAVGAAAAIGMLGSSAIKSFTAWEDALASVRKTTGMSKVAITELGISIDAMALRIPVAHEELAKIAAVAGQLGIKGKENILGFTETAAMMATAFDMAAEDVSISIAKLANIYQVPIEEASRLGSAINVLGNTTAASESQLMSFGMSLGPTAKQLGFTFTESMALGASMIEMGTDASDAGTRISRAFSKIGQNIDEVSSFMGVSADEFRESFENMPMETFTAVVEKLSSIEGSLTQNTIQSELWGEVGGKAVKAITGNLDGLIKNNALSAKGFAENVSLAEEFAAKTDTLKAKFSLVGNAAESFKITIGQALLPLVGPFAEGAAAAISGIGKAFSFLQNEAAPVIEMLLLKFNVLKAFMEGLFGPIVNAIKPLIESFNKATESSGLFNKAMEILTDITTIATGIAKKFGEVVGKYIVAGLTVLITKIREAVKELTDFYNELGPIKDVMEFLKDKVGDAADAIGDWADSFEDAEPPVRDLEKAVKDMGKTAEELEPVLEKSFKTLTDRLREASGDYKAAISKIDEEIKVLKNSWNLAADDQKASIEMQIQLLSGIRTELAENGKAAEDYHNKDIAGTEKATTKQEEFSVQLGKTKITFAGMAADIVKNANSYKELANQAQTLIDLDWSVFTTLKNELPNIDVGIKDMHSGFVGLKTVLEDNIVELEDLKETVMEISDIAAPFIEAGFLNGIKAIGAFGGALNDAGSAINSFSNLQEVSAEGAGNFSMHVYDMVTALTILEDQMEDLVPAFGNMDSLITGIADAFLYSGDKMETFGKEFGNAMENTFADLKEAGMDFGEYSDFANETLERGWITIKEMSDGAIRWRTIKVDSLWDVYYSILEGQRSFGELITSETYLPSTYTYKELTKGIKHWGTVSTEAFGDVTGDVRKYLESTYGVIVSQEEMYAIMQKPPAEQQKWLDDLMHSGKAVTFQMDKQTNALKNQTTELNKITNALEPYLKFMQTLNALSKLSTLSTTALQEGLNAIKNTLVNLGTALDGFDLETVMKGLFEETDSGVNRFTTDMKTYEAQFNVLVGYVMRFANSIMGLVSAFESLSEINKSVLADEEKTKEVFQGIVDVMSNFDKQMGDTGGFGNAFVKGMKAMLASAEPLITYFETSNDSVVKFNTTLGTFQTVLRTVIDTTKLMKKVSEETVPGVDALALGFDNAAEHVANLDKALLQHMGITEKGTDEERKYSSILSTISRFVEDWSTTFEGMKEDFGSFNTITDTITSLVSRIKALSEAFEILNKMNTFSDVEMGAGMQKVLALITNLATVMDLPVWSSITDKLSAMNTAWAGVSTELTASVESFNTFVTAITDMISISSRLSTAFKNAGEIIVVSADDMALALANVPAVIDELILLLDKPVWKSILTKLGEFKTAWGALSKETKDSIDAFNDIVSTLSSVLELSNTLSNVFTKTGDIIVTSANDMATALTEVPNVITQLTELLGKNVWKNIIKEITALDTEWKLVSEDMESSLESFTNVISAIETLITLPEKLAATFAESSEIVVTSTNDMATALAEVPGVISAITALLGKEIWTSIVDTLEALDDVWNTMDKEVLKSIDAFSKVASALSDIMSFSIGVTDTFTDMETIVVHSADQMAEALKEIPGILQSMTEYLGSDSFKEMKNGLTALSKEYKLHEEVLKEVMPSFETIASMLGSIISNVIGLSKAFETLAETTIVSSLDMERAMENVDIFIGRFAKEMHFSLDDLVKSLKELDLEWKVYSKDMEDIMPSFKAATGDITSLVQGVLSLSSALEDLSKIGIISSRDFDKGFSSLITSIVNFSVSLKTNVRPLIDSLKLLRNEWVKNAATLVPLMDAFQIITYNFTSLAVSANDMITSFDKLSKNSGSLEEGFNTLIRFIKNVEKATGEFYTPENAAMIARYIEDVETVISAFRQLEDKIEDALGDIEDAVSTSVNGVKGHIDSLSSLALSMNTYGANAVIAFASGMHDYLWVVEEEVMKISGIIQDYLGVESPTELGPLKYIEDWPRNLVKTFASGIQNEMSALNASFSGMTLGVSPDGGAGASVQASPNVTFTITQNISDKATADYANRELKALLKHQIM